VHFRLHLQFAFGTSLALIPIEILWDVFAKAAIRLGRDDVWYMFAFWALSVFLPAFICSMASVILNDDGILGTVTLEVKITVAVFSFLALLNRLGTVLCSLLLYWSFDLPQYTVLQRIISGSRVGGFNRSRIQQPKNKQRLDHKLRCNPLQRQRLQ